MLLIVCRSSILSFFFFNDTATTEIYTLSLHDALPIFQWHDGNPLTADDVVFTWEFAADPVSAATTAGQYRDRKSTRLNSSHGYISYAVFCLKKKKKSNSQIMP